MIGKLRPTIALTIALAFAAVPACLRTSLAAPPTQAPVADLSSLLGESVKKHKLAGMAAALVEGGRITAIGAAGVRCRGHEERITTDDLFHIGSDTKSMTATLIAVLVEEGKLRWNSTPFDVFAEKEIKDVDAAWKHVSLEQLLAHRGGVAPDPNLTLPFVKDESARQQRLRVCRVLLRKPPDHEPGKKYLYSNSGYIIAGAMAEAVTNDAWENLMINRVFRSLGMEHVGFGAPGASLAKAAKGSGAPPITQPWGHEPNGHPVEPGPEADNPPCYGPAGRVHLTLSDWSRYAVLHLSERPRNAPDRGASEHRPLLPVAALQRLHTPIGGSLDHAGTKYAMGWGVRRLAKSGGIELTHSGSNEMWYAVISLRMPENRAILIVTNQGGENASRACGEVKAALIKRGGAFGDGR
jgi:CubicO group peptidase (beta-lactamase class C family)